MNKLLITGCLLATAFAAVAMPNKKELAAAQKLVEDVIAPDVKALNAGRKTVKDVADIQMKLAMDAQSEAEKYLLLQSAFKLYSRGEEFDSAAKALTAISRDIKDVPPELITELVDKEFNRDMGLKAPKEIEAALLGESKAVDDRLPKYIDETRKQDGEQDGLNVRSVERRAIESIFSGMIQIPGHEFYISKTELTQAQWEAVIGSNPSHFKNPDNPVEMVSYDDAVDFVKKLNAHPGVAGRGFVFRLPHQWEWWQVAGNGFSGTNECLSTSWIKDNSSGTTHKVGTKKANHFGLYDIQGNVWEWTDRAVDGKGIRHGGCYWDDMGGCRVSRWIETPSYRRYDGCGLRLAADKVVPESEQCPSYSLERKDKLYCVIDISGGSSTEHYPVSYLDRVPEGGWSDEYKTTKIVLRRIDAGTWPMMGNRRVTFTKPFYIGIFELTQKQVKLMSGMPDRKFVFAGDMRPADCLKWEEMRGKNEEFDYPKTKEVASDSIIGKLRAKTGLAGIDLPTSYQFSCAWNAGTDGSGRVAGLTGRHYDNQHDGKGGSRSAHTVVGSYRPNEWGIYDLHGNVWEMCLDYAGKQSQEGEVDPEGPEKGEKRLCRGGGWHSDDRFVCTDYVPQNAKAGCRIVINAMPDEIKDAE